MYMRATCMGIKIILLFCERRNRKMGTQSWTDKLYKRYLKVRGITNVSKFLSV